MALIHVRAVQERTKLTDPIARSIIQVIATDIGFDGSPAFTSYRRIAERAGCHYNTVADRVQALMDSGDLVVTREGKRNYYQLPYEVAGTDSGCHTNTGDNSRGIVTHYVTREELSQQLSHMARELSQQLSHELAQLSHGLSQIVTPMGVTEEEEKEEVRVFPPPPPTPVNNGFRPNPVTSAVEPASTRRIRAILSVCQLDADVPAHQRKAENAAAQLARYEAAQIVQRYSRPQGGNGVGNGVGNGGWNWYVDDFRGQRGDLPTPGWIVDTISLGVSRPVTNQARTGASGDVADYLQIQELQEVEATWSL